MNYANLTPMMKQYIDTKKQYPDGILLFRAGDFYEMFYDDAKLASQILNITLTRRGKGEAPLAGIPYHSADPYIAKLVRSGRKVVVSEQIEDPKLAKGLVKRAVVRIITPSTLFAENYDNNYLCSIAMANGAVGFSFVDITTSEFKAGVFDNQNLLIDELSSIKPRELLITKNILNDTQLYNLIKKTLPGTAFNYSQLDSQKSAECITQHFKVNGLTAFSILENVATTTACGNALAYLKETQFAELSYINTIRQYNFSKYLRLDHKTVRNLELVVNTLDGSEKNSLFNLINKTKTPMGFRKLYFDILHPIANISEIKELQCAIEELQNNQLMLNALTEYLTYIGDLEKIISKIGFGNATPRDLIHLKQTLMMFPKIKSALLNSSSYRLQQISNNLLDLSTVVNLLQAAIVDDPPFSVRDGKFIKPSYSKELFELVNAHKTINTWLIEFENNVRQATGIKGLKLKYNKVFGYYLEVPKAQAKQVPDYFERKQTLINAERYTTKELSEKESAIVSAKEKRAELEYHIFIDLCTILLNYQAQIKATSLQLAELDVIVSCTNVATVYNYTKCELDNSSEVLFKDLRHAIIEQGVNYIPNDCFLNSDSRTMIITGPNMAGKSSYMRSVCIALILGHVFGYVPASYAKIGVIDGIFTRVGASDNLSQGQSTFLVEMTEVANILNNATKNSFVILDEIGRGTSTYDGVSLAWAIIEHIHNTIKCKTLVATHYHILNKMQELQDGIVNYHVTAEEEGDKLHFYHKLLAGGINKSYGIQVAKMAGIAKQVIGRALDIQKDFEEDAVFLGKESGFTLSTNSDTTKHKCQQHTILNY